MTVGESNDIEIATALTADFYAVVNSNLQANGDLQLAQLKGSDLAATLAILSSRSDLDDVDWKMVHHPGSVILPAVISVGLQTGANGAQVLFALRAGYYSMSMFSSAMNPEVRKHWHPTSVAGAIGAAHASAILYGMNDTQLLAALSLACTNAGGLSLAGLQRNGAAQFNRAAATAIGINAARAAIAGTPFLPGAYKKILDAWNQNEEKSPFETHSQAEIGLASASLRLLPFSGYMQAAVFGCYSTIKANPEIREIQVWVSPATYKLAVDTKETTNWVDHLWWSLPESLKFVAQTGDSFADRNSKLNEPGKIRIVISEDSTLRPYQATIVFIAPDGAHVKTEYSAPGLDPLAQQSKDLWQQKCSRYLETSGDLAQNNATKTLIHGFSNQRVEDLLFS